MEKGARYYGYGYGYGYGDKDEDQRETLYPLQ